MSNHLVTDLEDRTAALSMIKRKHNVVIAESDQALIEKDNAGMIKDSAEDIQKRVIFKARRNGEEI